MVRIIVLKNGDMAGKEKKRKKKKGSAHLS